MKTQGAILFTLFSSALASPAIVWKTAGKADGAPLRTSKALKVNDLLTDVLTEQSNDSSLAAVVFLLGRNKDGSESLTELASSNDLPKVAVKYGNASCIHHNVQEVKSANVMIRDSKDINSVHSVQSVTLDEFNTIMSAKENPISVELSQVGTMSKAQKSINKRSAQLSGATAFIVEIDPLTNPSEIDTAIDSTVDNDSVANVVLTAVRSHDEVKHERYLAGKTLQKRMEKAGRRSLQANHRRLENEENDDGQNDDGQESENMSGIYYVSMTPNILAGLLFWLMFSVVAFLGLSCMGMIAGQDVYVKKMPAIGREA